MSDLLITEKDGMVYVASRAQNNINNPDKMLLLSPDHPCTGLILKSMHDIKNRGVNYSKVKDMVLDPSSSQAAGSCWLKL